MNIAIVDDEPVFLLLRQLNIDSPYISLYELFRGHIGIVVVKSIDQLLPK